MLNIISTLNNSTFIFISASFLSVIVSIKQVVTIRFKIFFFVLFPFCFHILTRFRVINDIINIIIIVVKVYLTRSCITIRCNDLYISLSTTLEIIWVFYRFYQRKSMQYIVDMILSSRIFYELLPHYIIFNLFR